MRYGPKSVTLIFYFSQKPCNWLTFCKCHCYSDICKRNFPCTWIKSSSCRKPEGVVISNGNEGSARTSQAVRKSLNFTLILAKEPHAGGHGGTGPVFPVPVKHTNWHNCKSNRLPAMPSKKHVQHDTHTRGSVATSYTHYLPRESRPQGVWVTNR